MAVTPRQLEEGLIAVLKAAFPELPVKPYPDNLEGYKMFHARAEIFTAFRGGPFNPPQQGSAAQDRVVQFEIGLVTRSLSGHQGAVDLLEEVRQAVQGVRPHAEARPMWVIKDGYLGRDTGQWWYALFVATRVSAIPAPPPVDSTPASPHAIFRITSEEVTTP